MRAKAFIAAVALVWSSWLAAAAPPAPANPDDARRAVARIADESWQWVLATDNALRDAAGLPFAGVKDIDIADARKDADFASTHLATLRAIDPKLLDSNDEITRQFLLKLHEDVAQGPDNWLFDFAITPYSGVLPLNGLVEFASKRPLATPAQRADYLRLLAELGDRIDQMHARTVAQREAGIYLPKPAIPSLRATYQALAAGLDARLVPDAGRLGGLQADERAAYAAEVGSMVQVRLATPITAIATLLGPDYEAKAPAAIGLSQYP
ncbi:MAG: DUF885 family protein, partial [Sandaracinobacter sp.]